MKKIGILGGTFDPIHWGHLKIAEAAQKQFRLEKVLFIPALTPPHKIRETALTPAHHRYEMTSLAVEGYPGFEVSDLEINSGGISYTVETLRDLYRRDPYSEFFLIVGADAFQSFKDWKEPEEIQKLAKILVVPRPGIPPLRHDLEGVFPIPMDEEAVSSSEIREKLAVRSPSVLKLLPEKVWHYIQGHQLYLQPKGVL